MTFSFRPTRESDLPFMAASVRTLVVSWKDAALSHESVASDAFVMPISIWRPEAGWPPSAATRRFCVRYAMRSTSSPGMNVVSPGSRMVTRRSI